MVVMQASTLGSSPLLLAAGVNVNTWLGGSSLSTKGNMARNRAAPSQGPDGVQALVDSQQVEAMP